MNRDVIIVVTFLVLFACPGCRAATGNSLNGTGSTSYIEDKVNAGVQAVYTMTNFFLCDVVQSSLLTSLPAEYTTSTDVLLTSIIEQWQSWAVHYIGYVVCAAIGIVGFFVMLFAAMIFPCCRCCGRCGAKDPELLRKKRKSRCCIRLCELSMVIVTVSLILANLSMYAVNEKFYPQLKTGVFDDVVTSLDTIDQFIKQIPSEINDTVQGGFVDLETSLFQTLDDIPANAMTAIDNATGAVTSLAELSTFTGNSVTLNTTMIEAIQLAETLDQQTKDLWNDFTTINSSITTQLAACSSPSCQYVLGLMAAAQVAVNFTAVNETLIPKQQVISLAIQNGLIELVNDSVSQLESVNTTVINTMNDTTLNVKDQCEQAGQALQDAMIELSDTLGSINISDINNTIVPIEDTIQMPADIAYYVVIGLSAVISLIIVSNVVGVILGIVLPPCRPQPTTKKNKKECCRKSTASHFLMLSVALTFLLYWLYTILVLILFLAGGLMETELCRHMVKPNNERSAGVLAIYDSWLNNSLGVSGNLDILPFQIYNECSSGVTVYKALNMEQSWNLTDLTNTKELSQAIADLKTTDISIPQVNLTNDNLTQILTKLEDALNPNVLNVTELIDDVSGSIIDRDLRDIRDGADATGVNLSIEIANLNSLINSSLINIESTRNELIDKLANIQRYIGNTNFTATSLTLDSAQQEINANGSDIVGKFINDTGDGIYDSIVNFSDQTVDSVENKIAVCLPLYTAISELVNAVCVKTLYPLNSFWFSLGWCLAFLVPSLIMAVKLTTVYRYTQAANGVGHTDI